MQDQYKPLTVIFDNCEFKYNSSPSNGGAFRFNSNEINKTVNIIFINCSFTENKCEKSGGALSFTLENDIIIQNCTFNSNICQAKGGSIFIASINNNVYTKPIIIDCQFLSNYADNEGGAIFIYVKSSVEINDCEFIDNTAGSNSSDHNHTNGGALSLQSDFTIKNCTFEKNNAYYSSSNFSKMNGKGGAIYINDYENILSKEEIIENCTFKSNQGYYGYAIYIKSDNEHLSITINKNSFIDKKTLHLKSSIIESEICNFPNEKVIRNNYFLNKISENISVKKLSCYDEPTYYYTVSSTFSYSSQFSSQIQTQSISLVFSSIKATYSMSLSLTYVRRRSVSFSISCFASNTFEMSYDVIKETYILVSSQMIYQSYFPYIIYIYSPIYIELTVFIKPMIRRRISTEKLIGISCGSVCLLFLILSIIILFIKRKNEIQKQIDEYEDLSDSPEDIGLPEQFNGETNQHDNHKTDINSEFDEQFTDFELFL